MFVLSAGRANAALGEVYSESTYVPQYGILDDSQIRFFLFKNEQVSTYIGAAAQLQIKTKSSQDPLYEKNRTMAMLGARISLWKNLSALIELRTEERSRGGLYVGDMWQYAVLDYNMFSEFYAESIVLPSFHHDPVTTAWFKQGLRFHAADRLLVDPYVELYLSRSPTPDLGRDTEQARIGVRGIYLYEGWTVATLLYESFPRNEAPHEEALLVIGGSF